MTAGRIIVGIAAGATMAACALVAPAFAALDKQPGRAPAPRQQVRSIGGFTPAAGDPRLAALLARGGLDAGNGNEFRFTPAEARRDTRAVTVAVRARTNRAVSTRSVVADGTVGRVVVAGGETSGAVVTALGTTALVIGPPLGPGVCWSAATTSAGRPVALVLKSGNFGAADLFSTAWEALS